MTSSTARGPGGASSYWIKLVAGGLRPGASLTMSLRGAKTHTRHCCACSLARSDSDDPSTLAAQATPGSETAEARRAKAEAIHPPPRGWVDCFAEPVIGRAFARPVGSQ